MPVARQGQHDKIHIESAEQTDTVTEGKLLGGCASQIVQSNQEQQQQSTQQDVEMDNQPVSLKLCLYGGKEATVERSFARQTTLDELQQEMRKVFNISSDRETKLWVHSSVYVFRPTDSSGAASNDELNKSGSDSKENEDTSNSAPGSNQKLGNQNLNSISSPIKPPPTPSPTLASNSTSTATVSSSTSSSSSSSTQNDSTATKFATATSASPTVITRQAAQTMNLLKPIALPDSTSTLEEQIDKSHQTLTEAGVAENAVITLEVINNDGTWPSSRPRYGVITTRSSKTPPGLCGLSNMGNTCFMNAALQCLSNTPPLTNYILTDKFIDDINTNNPLGMHGEIARTYADLIKVLWSGNHGSFLPREFKCAVSRFAPQFTGFAQQDCQELMAFLLDGLHEDLNRIKNKPYIEIKDNTERRPDEEVAKESWANYKKRNDSVVVDTFHAMLKSTLICPECELVSVTFDPFCYLSLPLPVKREKQVNLFFISAPTKLNETNMSSVFSKLDFENIKLIRRYGARISSFVGNVESIAGCQTPATYPRNCKMQVPRAGPAAELCELVARIINEERLDMAVEPVNADNLVVAEVANGKIHKIYESNEHYNQISDDIVVVEKASKFLIPLYIKESKNKKESPSYSRFPNPDVYFLHVPDLKYETLYRSIVCSLSNLVEENDNENSSYYGFDVPEEPSEEQSMECDVSDNLQPEDVPFDDDTQKVYDGDEPTKQTNGKTQNASSSTNDAGASSSSSSSSSISGNKVTCDSIPGKNEAPFTLCVVNSFGSHSFETLGHGKKECDYSSKLYLGAFFKDGLLQSTQFLAPSSNSFIQTFTPKLSQKPILQLKDCITQFTNAERLGADDPWYCPKCKKHQQAIKKFDVWSLPKVLIIHLKRFSFSRSWRDKIDTLVEFPIEGLDMSSYVHNPEQKKPSQPMIYNLIGVANHFGGLGGGHYTAYAKNEPLDAWYSFDDALVTQTNASNVVTRSAYVLFYQLQE